MTRKLFLFVLGVAFWGWPNPTLVNLPEKSWYRAPDSKIRPVVPPKDFNGWGYNFSFYVTGLIDAWNSGIYDTKRNRMIVWGGGHNDYYGNEFYSFDVATLKWSRPFGPSKPNSYQGSCIDPLPDGNPNSRHTYDGLAYIAKGDRFFANGGSLGCGSGGGGTLTWTHNFETNQWTNQKPSGSGPNYHLGKTSAYDPHSGDVYMHDNHYLFRYTYGSNTWEKLSGYNYFSYGYTAEIDPKRGLLFIIGQGDFYTYDIGKNDYTRKAFNTTGASGIEGVQAPGLKYDPVADKMVGFASGNVYVLDIDTRVWTQISKSGGPATTGGGASSKIYDRWQYIPDFNVFVFVSSIDDDVHFFKNTAGGGAVASEGPTQKPLNPLSVFPNPARSTVQVKITGAENWTGQVFSIGGRRVKTFQGSGFSARDLPVGVYEARIKANGKTFRRRLHVLR